MHRDQRPNVHVSGGVGFLGMLTIALIVLKLTKLIEISWFMVFLPLWFIPALIVVGIIVFLGGAFLIACYKDWKKAVKKQRRLNK